MTHSTHADPSLQGEVVVLTGAGRGLGRAFATAIAEAGAKLLINDIDLDVAQETAHALCASGADAIADGHDVSDPAQAQAMIAAAALGPVRALVNNAAIHHRAALWEETPQRAQALLRVNLLGAINCAIAIVPLLRVRRAGAILNVTSSSALGLPDRGTYAATKAALLSLTYSWALELAGDGVRVNALAPRARTRLTDATPGPIGSVEDVAPVARYLVSDQSWPLTGQCVRADGLELGWLLPGRHGPLVRRDGDDSDAVTRAVVALPSPPSIGFHGVVPELAYPSGL